VHACREPAAKTTRNGVFHEQLRIQVDPAGSSDPPVPRRGASPSVRRRTRGALRSGSLYGPGKDGVAKSHHASPKDDPSYVWLGSCTQLCGFTLRHKQSFMDLTGLAKIRWRRLDTRFMNDGPWVEKPDLSKVDEIGWTDLAAGSGHGSGGLVGIASTGSRCTGCP
jgi:hypothetical protein